MDFGIRRMWTLRRRRRKWPQLWLPQPPPTFLHPVLENYSVRFLLPSLPPNLPRETDLDRWGTDCIRLPHHEAILWCEIPILDQILADLEKLVSCRRDDVEGTLTFPRGMRWGGVDHLELAEEFHQLHLLMDWIPIFVANQGLLCSPSGSDQWG